MEPRPVPGSPVRPSRADGLGATLDGAAADDPFAPVLGLDARPTRHTGVALGLSGALLVHGAIAVAGWPRWEGLGAFAASIRAAVADSASSEFDVEVASTPAAPPLPKPGRDALAATTETASRPLAAPPSPPSPPQPVAQAGRALTVAPAVDEPLDATPGAVALATGDADRDVGGASAGWGTAATAAERVAPGGPRAAPVTPAAVRVPSPKPAAAPDRSRPAGVLGSTTWSTCPFPDEADQAQVDAGRVTLVVSVDARGRPRAIAVRGEAPSGFGFATRARQCAMSRRYEPALDASGHPTAGTTPPLHVRFTR